MFAFSMEITNLGVSTKLTYSNCNFLSLLFRKGLYSVSTVTVTTGSSLIYFLTLSSINF